jgi:hypothetical protein
MKMTQDKNKTKHGTLRNISKGASNIDSTSAGFKTGLNAFVSWSRPMTGTTLRRCYKRNNDR